MTNRPAIPRCERCQGRLATVNLGDVQDGVKTMYRICSDCWTSLGDACPRSVKTDEDAVTHWILDTLRDERARGEHPGAPA